MLSSASICLVFNAQVAEDARIGGEVEAVGLRRIPFLRRGDSSLRGHRADGRGRDLAALFIVDAGIVFRPAAHHLRCGVADLPIYLNRFLPFFHIEKAERTADARRIRNDIGRLPAALNGGNAASHRLFHI